MKVYVGPGRAIDLGAGRSTSAHGGIYDLDALELSEERQAALVAHERVVDPEVATAEAAELAQLSGLELAEISGSGKGGRIVKGDVEQAIKATEQESE